MASSLSDVTTPGTMLDHVQAAKNQGVSAHGHCREEKSGLCGQGFGIVMGPKCHSSPAQPLPHPGQRKEIKLLKPHTGTLNAFRSYTRHCSAVTERAAGCMCRLGDCSKGNMWKPACLASLPKGQLWVCSAHGKEGGGPAD